MSLLEEIVSEIKRSGPISVARYMELCLTHPEHGYYMKQDPFGQGGDFTTAPEISQMFGEILAAWVIDRWMQMGSPKQFMLVEMGPGRGTLMSDILRVSQKFTDFYSALNIRLLETSPHLKKLQQQNLQVHSAKVEWLDSLDAVDEVPAIFIANEFFDALPINQFLATGGNLNERTITEKDGKLEFVEPEEKNIIEVSEISEQIIRQISHHITKNNGAALIVDYGYNQKPKPFGDTLQALKKHQYHPVLETPGEADITAHVDFAKLAEVSEATGCKTSITPQGIFLNNNGIVLRAKMLMKNADEKLQKQIINDLERLISPDQMGDLFKVMVIECS